MIVDLDWLLILVLLLCRLFASLLKDRGPMDPNDSMIQSELEKCSTNAQVVICEAGGICKFLRQSLQFAVVDGYICLASDAGKARQLARSRRQAMLYHQQPQLKLNPPPSLSVSASAGAILSHTNSSSVAGTRMSMSLAGMDLPLSSRVIPGLPQEVVSGLSNVPQFLSQPSATYGMFQPDMNSSSVIQTAVHSSNYNDNGSKRINGGNTYDTWVTVSKAAKSSTGVRNLDIGTSGGIGELDDFSEHFMSENSSNVSKLTLNEDTVGDNTTNDEQFKQHIHYTPKELKNIAGISGSDSSYESSNAGTVDSSASSESEEDHEDIQGNESEMTLLDANASSLSNHHTLPVSSLDTFDTEVAETCAPQLESVSTALSVSAPEFIPLKFAANQPSLTANVDKSSPNMSTSSRASSHSRPSSTAAITINRRVQTDESWTGELQQLKDSHALQVAAFEQQLYDSMAHLQVSVPVCVCVCVCVCVMITC